MSEMGRVYCRKCSYDLRGQKELRCPECGQTFDPADPRTVRRRPRTRWIRRAAVSVVAIVLLASAPFGWLYWEWRSEQPAVARMRQLGADLDLVQIDFPFRRGLVWRGVGWLLERVGAVNCQNNELGDEELILLSRCSRLVILRAYRGTTTDRGIAAVSHLQCLRVLWVGGAGITDASAKHLLQCRQLDDLWLFRTSVTDAGLDDLCKLPELQSLGVGSEAITDAGLTRLTNCPRLEELRLFAPRVGDDGLATLSRLSRLRELQLEIGPYSRAAAGHLRKSLPKSVILMDP